MTRPVTDCPLWRWMGGARYRQGPNRPWYRYDPISDDQPSAVWVAPDQSIQVAEADPNDPATVGCLLALVRNAWGIPGLGVHCDRNGTAGGWVVADGEGKPGPLRRVFADTEWDALCAALWAASERAP